MKEHSQSLQCRSLLLASCRKWTVGLWGRRPRCFQKKHFPLPRRRKRSCLTSFNVKPIKPFRRRALPRRSWVPDVLFNINQPVGFIQNCTRPQNLSKTPFSSCGTPYSGSKGLHRTPCQTELLAKYIDSGADPEVYQDKQCNPEASIIGLSLQSLSLHLAPIEGDRSNDGSKNGIIILNNSTRKYCCRGLKQNGTCGLLIARRSKFNQRTLRRFLFMMHKKLSLVKFRIRIAKSLPKLRRGKACQLNKSKLSWVAKVARDWQEDRHSEAFAEARGTFLPSQNSKRRSPWNLFCFSDMNNNMPGPLIEESQTCRPDACLTQERLFHCRELHYKNLSSRDQNGIAETCLLPVLQKSPPSETEAMPRTDAGEMPSLDSCPEDIFISVTEKEISISGHDEEESNQAMGADEVVLESSKLDLGASDDCTNGPVLEPVQNEDCRSQMEVEGPIGTEVFGAKLLDHLYCKSPLDEPLRGSTGQKSGTPKGGKRSSQKVSCVSDEQLAAWLCGICLFCFFLRY